MSKIIPFRYIIEEVPLDVEYYTRKPDILRCELKGLAIALREGMDVGFDVDVMDIDNARSSMEIGYNFKDALFVFHELEPHTLAHDMSFEQLRDTLFRMDKENGFEHL
jgi:hypothetical protein